MKTFIERMFTEAFLIMLKKTGSSIKLHQKNMQLLVRGIIKDIKDNIY